MAKTKQSHPLRLKIISTAVYVLLMAALILIRFPITIDQALLRYTGAELPVSEVQDTHGNPVLPDLSLMYDAGDGYVYEGKVSGKTQTVTNSIRAVQQGDAALFTIYQDGDPTLITNLNSLVGLRSLRLNLPADQSITLQALEFYHGDQLVRTISPEDFGTQFTIHDAEFIQDGENLIVSPTGEDPYLEVDASSGSWFHKLTHSFSFANVAMMVIFTVIYLVVGHGHALINKLQQKLLTP